MLKKLTGILILLSFLMVKTTMLVSYDDKSVQITQQMDHQGEELPEDSKEHKQLEYSLDDEISPYHVWIDRSLSSEKLNHFNFPQITMVHLSLPNPPPNAFAA